MNIISSSAYMKANNLITSPLETECLFGEQVEIIEEHFSDLIQDLYVNSS